MVPLFPPAAPDGELEAVDLVVGEALSTVVVAAVEVEEEEEDVDEALGRVVSMTISTALQISTANATVAARSASLLQSVATQVAMSERKALLEQMHLGSMPQLLPVRSLVAHALEQSGRAAKSWAATRAAPAMRRTVENFIFECGF